MVDQLVNGHHSGLIGTQPTAPDSVVETRKLRREAGFPTGWLIAPATLWLIVFLVIPLISIIVFSFWTASGHGMTPDLTLQHYGDYFYNEGFFDPADDNFVRPSVFIRTIGSTFYFTLVVMAFCLVLGYPIAYFLAMQVKNFKWQLALFLFCMVPFWTSYLIRAVAWIPMLGRRGLFNKMLMGLDIIDKPIEILLYSEFGYTMALVQLYVVLCVGPIFFSLAKIDLAIVEAAKDMGATPFQIFREIIGPLSLPGVAIGMIFIFVIIMGNLRRRSWSTAGKRARRVPSFSTTTPSRTIPSRRSTRSC